MTSPSIILTVVLIIVIALSLESVERIVEQIHTWTAGNLAFVAVDH